MWLKATLHERARLKDAERLRTLHERATAGRRLRDWLAVATGWHSAKRAAARYDRRRAAARERLKQVARDNGWTMDVINEDAIQRELEQQAVDRLATRQRRRVLRDFVAEWRELTRLRRMLSGKLFASGRMHNTALLRQCLSAMMDLVAEAQLAWASEGRPWARRKLWATASRVGRDAKTRRAWRTWHTAVRSRKQLKRALKVMMSRSVSANFSAWRKETNRLRGIRADAAQQWLLVSRAMLAFPFSRWRGNIAAARAAKRAATESCARLRLKFSRQAFRRAFRAWRGACKTTVEDSLKHRIAVLEISLAESRRELATSAAELESTQNALQNEVQRRIATESGRESGGAGTRSRRSSQAGGAGGPQQRRRSFSGKEEGRLSCRSGGGSSDASGATTPDALSKKLHAASSKAERELAAATLERVRVLVTPASAYAKARRAREDEAGNTDARELQEELDAAYRVIEEVAAAMVPSSLSGPGPRPSLADTSGAASQRGSGVVSPARAGNRRLSGTGGGPASPPRGDGASSRRPSYLRTKGGGVP